MNLALLLAFVVSVLGGGHAYDSSNPECRDLDSMQKKVTKAITLLGKVKCTPNKNCTGLICDGEMKKKPFHATINLEACNDPVRMQIHVNNKYLTVKSGDHKKIASTPPTTVWLKLERKGDIVYVTITLKPCLGKVCPPIPVVSRQKIRVHCNGSGTTMLPSLNPSMFPDGGNNSGNPECKGLIYTKRQVQSQFALISKIYPGSYITCNPANNCSDLVCSGVANHDHFTSTMSINYCTHPITMKLKVDVESKGIHLKHTFKDGDQFQIVATPPIYLKVNLRRVHDTIYLTAVVQFSKGPLSYPLVRNRSITVDPSHCQDYHGPSPFDPSARKSKMDSSAGGKSLSTGAIAGIVIAAIVLFVLLIGVVVWIVRDKRQRVARYNDLAMNDDTDPLVFDSEPVSA